MSVFKKIVLIVAALSVAFSFSNSSHARVVAHEPNLVSHDLQCDSIFPCPEIIVRRVDFWVSVFRLWGKDNRVLHDSNKPERVYSVLETKDECRRKNPKGEVKQETINVKARLAGLAKLIESGASKAQIKKHRYAKLFPKLDLKEVKQARKSIRCQSGNREMFTNALTEFKRYQPYVQKALIEKGLPLDIQYLPFVESSYNPKAYSYAGAAGMWQIMPRTARSLGLQIGGAIDERFEPEFATLGAAKYFRNSIDKLSETAKEHGHSSSTKDLNPFVITSYNYGVRGMERAIEQVGTDYTKLLNEYKSRSFQTAVKNFYASFLAARYVAQNNQLYFSGIADPKLNRISRIALPKPLLTKHVVSALRVSKDRLKELNPAITNRAWRNQVAVPTGFVLKVPANVDLGIAKSRLKKKPTHRFGRGDSGIRHKVRSGQTACGVARRYKVRCKDLIALNRLDRKAVIRIGQRLKIPGGVQKYRTTNIVKDSITLRKALLLDNNSVEPTISASTNVTKQPQQVVETAKVLQEKPKEQVKEPIKESTVEPSQVVNQEPAEVQDDVNSSPNEKIVNLNTAVSKNKGIYSVIVLPSESLGLYSDWLSIGSTREMRRLNKLKGKAAVNVNQRIILPIKSNDQKRRFLLARDEYHLNIQLQYFQRFQVVSVSSRTLRSGETLWSLARNRGIPLWLLMQYNPNVRAGSIMQIPEVRRK